MLQVTFHNAHVLCVTVTYYGMQSLVGSRLAEVRAIRFGLFRGTLPLLLRARVASRGRAQ